MLLTSFSYLFLLLGTTLPTSLATLVDNVFSNPNIPFIEDHPPTLLRRTTKPNKRAQTLNYVTYSITLDGRGQGNWEEFLVTGTMLAVDGISSPGTSNGANPTDIYISIGSPAANPIAGSIRYFSNRGLYSLAGGTNAQSLIDYATVTISGDTTTFVVDGSLAAANQLSGFNARSGLLADIYLIASGIFSLSVTEQGVLSGSVNVVGQGYISPGTAPYKAVVSGQATGKGVVSI